MKLRERIEPLGDRALIIDLRGSALTPIEGARRLAEASDMAWLTDVIPAYDSLTVVYDPAGIANWMRQGGYARRRARQVRHAGREAHRPSMVMEHMRGNGVRQFALPDLPYEAAAEIVLELLIADADRDGAGTGAGERWIAGRTIEIPVQYGGEYGPDLAECAARAGMDESAFAAAHASCAYSVAMIGFMPGFPYLAGMDESLAQPRKAQPRPHVPAGSVGIAGMQTGIYPFASPGGWQIIGRTSMRLFDPEAEQPAVLRAGDQVRFVPVQELDAETVRKGGD
jgi:allophanate hydrolase subunit 1